MADFLVYLRASRAWRERSGWTGDGGCYDQSMAERVISLDLGCQPDCSGSGELILQDEKSCFVMFLAIDSKLSEEGFLEDKGIAVVECVGFHLSRHGYPNDEGRQEHPLWNPGLSNAPGVAEVLESSWLDELEDQMERSAERLWAAEWFRNRERKTGLRHFVLEFKETTFEVLAEDLKVTVHPTPARRYEDVAGEVLRRFFADD